MPAPSQIHADRVRSLGSGGFSPDGRLRRPDIDTPPTLTLRRSPTSPSWVVSPTPGRTDLRMSP